jgi:uncharacterized membrane protein
LSVLAATRPTGWDFPLFLHVLGAMVLVGGLTVAVAFQLLAWKKRDPADVAASTRAGFRALLAVALPGLIVMRIGAQWVYSKEGWSGDNDPAWLGIGYLTADLGGILLLITIILAGLGARRLRRSEGSKSVLTRIAMPLATLLLIAYVVAVWAMTTKPD